MEFNPEIAVQNWFAQLQNIPVKRFARSQILYLDHYTSFLIIHISRFLEISPDNRTLKQEKIKWFFIFYLHFLQSGEQQAGKCTEAQYQLGSWYDGRLVINNELCENEDVEEALKWYHKAAEQGHRDAKMRIKQHDLLAAEKGDAEAQYRVGCYYLEPHASDLRDMAVDYLRKAAEQEHEKAKEKLNELERTYTAWEKARPQDGEKDDTIVTERTELIEAGKYCYIVVSMGNTNLFIWSYLKARYRESEDFRYIKTSIYDTINHDLIFFENGKELYVFDNLDLLEYNGKKYDIGTHRNVFVDDDKLGVGMSIRTFR